MLFYVYVILVFFLKRISCTIEGEKQPYHGVKIEDRDQLSVAIEKILKTAPKYTKGGAALAIQLIREQKNEKGYIVDRVYKSLDRSPYVGILPRCLCRYVTCTVPICSSVCLNSGIERKAPFECLGCLSECIPLFMRCLTGSEH